MIEETAPARCRKKYPPTPGTTRPRRWMAYTTFPFVAPEKTRHGWVPPLAPWPHTQGTVRQGPNAPQAADETGTRALRPSDGDG